jgi:hypothetical protein
MRKHAEQRREKKADTGDRVWEIDRDERQTKATGSMANSGAPE